MPGRVHVELKQGLVGVLGLLMGVGLSLAWSAEGAAQTQVRVLAETRIDLAAERAGASVLVLGVLRDDLGQALPHREVQVTTRPADTADSAAVPPGVFGTQLVSTDARGEFTLSVEWAASPFILTCAFTGDDYHLAATVERSVDPTLADVRLRFDLDVTGRELDLDAPETRVRVLAESSAGGDALPLELRDELGRAYGEASTDTDGYALFTLEGVPEATPGPGRWVVEFRGDARRASARAELAIVRTRATQLAATLEDDTLDPGDEAVVTGELTDARGTVVGGAVGIFAEGEHLLTVATDREGRFRAPFTIPAEREGARWTLEARFAPETPGLRPSSSDPLVLRVGSPLPLDWLWLLLPVGLSAAAFALARRRERTAAGTTAGAPQSTPGVTVGARTLASHRHDVLGGVVLDHQNDTALAGATVTLTRVDEKSVDPEVSAAVSGADGRFVLAGLPAGEYRLRVARAGYVELDQRVHVPHRGEWSDIVVRVESYRTRALSVFRRVGRLFVSSERVFETTTNRELPESAPEAQRAPLAALAEHTDRLYYGPRDPEAADLPPLEEAAAALVEALPEPATNVEARD
ncbi:MAG: carboxypeptidase regulatory-like domain-containing protein [Sandaracinaceae bacterium]|nr:carboxypeptidase regulatory-like domain-containing protein [Sandaracinaceae bacterium]